MKIREYKESDFDTRSRKELPVIVAQALALIWILSFITCYGTAIWVLK